MSILRIERKSKGFCPRVIIRFLGIKLTITSWISGKTKNLENYFANSQEAFILVFDHALEGGAQSFLYNKIKQNNIPIIRIQQHPKYEYFKITTYNTKNDFCIFDKNLNSISKTLNCLNIEKIIVNNLVGYHSLTEIFGVILNLHKKKNLPITYMVHDYFSLCPSCTLVNTITHKYCGLNFDKNICKDCCSEVSIKPKEISENFDIDSWHKLWKDFLANVTEIRTFSPSAKEIIKNCFPEFTNITLIPHEIEPFEPEKINIGVLGNLSVPKGLGVIKDFCNYLDENNIKNIRIHIIGNTTERIVNKNVTISGFYVRDDLPKILKEKNIHLIFIPSICPETFSYTTAEAISLNYPVMCFDIGGQADQIKKYSKGIITKQTMEDLYKNIINYSKLGKEEHEKV